MNNLKRLLPTALSFITLSVLTACGSTVQIDANTDKDPVVTQPDDNQSETPDNTQPETPAQPAAKVIDVNTADPTLPSFVSFEDNTPNGKKWQKVQALTDEFDIWDSSKWTKTYWNYGNTPVNMMDKNAGVSNGYLWLQATLDEGSADQWFETARVRSKTKIKFPMYTESRIKTADISAYNTFWLNNGDSNNRDEIDIIENNSNPSMQGAKYDKFPYEMHSQYFVVRNGVTERAGDENPSNSNQLSEGNTLRGVAWNEAYHVYGAWWKDAYTVQFYLDGEPVNFVKTKQPFTLEQFIIWDLWTQNSSWVGGLPAKSDLLDDTRNTMKVDWVRTWQLVDE